MHQPYYRSARTGVFGMPWARMHALKDYLDMVKALVDYPALHQTFNLVPSLVEQLEDYASGDFSDTYWDHTLKPAAELTPAERAFVVERMCERSDHPRARSHPRYLELAHKRDAHSSHSWEECAAAFTVAELRDLQVWFNLAWFDPRALAVEPLLGLASRGRDFSEEDKQVLVQVQADILARTLPAYREAAARGQVELSTSPYFHPILPLLINSDSARISAGDTILPPRRFAHPEDAAQQVASALEKHERVFGEPPRGMWCSEQAVGEDVLPLLLRAGLEWTISDETVLARSLSGAAIPRGAACSSRGAARAGGHGGAPPGAGPHAGAGPLSPEALYTPYRLEREQGEMAIIFRDHTLSDLIGFAYQSWDSRDAAADLLRRLREIHATLASGGEAPSAGGASSRGPSPYAPPSCPLVTIALDGENAWEYYPRDGRDFLQYLYEGLSADPSLRCVTIAEHLRECPPVRSLSWLHTGSWIGGHLRTWSGDRAHNIAWDLLHQARDLAATSAAAARSDREPAADQAAADLDVADRPVTDPDAADLGAADLGATSLSGPATDSDAAPTPGAAPPSAAAPPKPVPTAASSPEAAPPAPEASNAATAWRHILIAEGSDWFWWFGDHHRTELDHVWDLEFRTRLQEVYCLLDRPVPTALLLPILDQALSARPSLPQGPVTPLIDGRVTDPAEWQAAGLLAADLPSTMQRSEETAIDEVRFGWHGERLCVLVVPGASAFLEGLDVELRVTRPGLDDDPIVRLTLEEQGRVGVSFVRWTRPLGVSGTASSETGPGGAEAGEIAWEDAGLIEAAWGEVLEVSLSLGHSAALLSPELGLVVHTGRDGMTERVFHSAGLTSIAGREQ
jgi:alpha-amylase/alpha-mannosidase (GH57 family)